MKAIVRRCFQQRRKQAGAVLREILPGKDRPWRELLAAEGFPYTVRAEAIPVTVWIKLASLGPSPA
jgi:16S rRNA (adenine1518-N6/adenine1519-N6)-dimethyltransferase